MKKTLIFVAMLATLAFTSCKPNSEPEAPNPSTPEVQTSEVTDDASAEEASENADEGTNEPDAEDANAESNVTVVPEKKFVDYGDDELGAALNTYQQNGYWFKDGVPKLIENTASNIYFYEPIEDENGKVYQFAVVNGPFDFDGDSSSDCIPYIYIYEGEANLKDAIKLFQANWRSLKFNDDLDDNMRTFFPREAGTLPNGLTVKDSYVINDMPNNIERYNGKHVFVFGGNTETPNRDVEYIFDLQ
ncbi:MAG: hypothetical protein II150_02310 [Thermoguttaceae bacterium]|nr:hypothetical protein [Thermoguttaceae bacterium]